MVTGRIVEVNNKYYAVLNLKHPDGSRFQKRFDLELPVPNNKRRAAEKLHALCEEYTRKQNVEQNHPDALLIDFIEQWIEARKADISPSTYRNYIHIVRHHMSNYFASTTLRQLTYHEIEAYYVYLREKGLSSTTVQHHHALLRSALQEACKREMIARNPVEYVDKPKRQTPKVSCYSAEEAKKLLEAVKGTNLEVVVTLTLVYGFRRSEVLALKWEDIYFDEGTISVRHTVVEGVEDGQRVLCEKEKMKEEASYRTMPLFEPITSMLNMEKLKKMGFLCDFVCTNRWGKPMRPDVLTHEFSDFLAENGFRHIRFHDLRHSCASLLIAAHMPLIQVQHWLGHSTMMATADLYSHLDYSLMEECGEGIKKN